MTETEELKKCREDIHYFYEKYIVKQPDTRLDWQKEYDKDLFELIQEANEKGMNPIQIKRRTVADGYHRAWMSAEALGLFHKLLKQELDRRIKENT